MTFALRILALLFLAAGPALAQSYPSKPIRLVIGLGVGGVTDVMLRILADETGKRLGQPMVVENRPGAGSFIAANTVKMAVPDGYTLYGGTGTGFSPVYLANGIVASKELTPISTVAYGDWFMYVPTSLGIKSLDELAAFAKAKPNNLRFAAPSTINNLLMAVVAKRMGFSYELIPYKATDQTITALLAGDAQVTFNALPGFGPHLQSGKLRAIATLAPRRIDVMPDVPTVSEQGVPLEVRFLLGLWGPPGMPREVVAKLNVVANEALRAPLVVERTRGISLSATGSTPEELLRGQESEMRFLVEAAEIVGLKPQ